MTNLEIEDVLRQWTEIEAALAPVLAVKRTTDCLLYSELAAASDPTNPLANRKRPHTDTCPWCSRALRSYERVAAEKLASRYQLVAEVGPKGLSEDSIPAGELPYAVRELAEKWFRANEPAEGEPSPGYFDAAGDLQIARANLPDSGTVELRLKAGDLLICDVKRELMTDQLDVTLRLADWGLTNLRVSDQDLKIIQLS